MRQKVLLFCSALLGLLIAYTDSRPNWDDAGITVLVLVGGGTIVGLLLEKHPWLFALAIGISIPIMGILARHDLMMLIVLIFPFIGVYTGWAIRLLSKRILHLD